MSLPDVDGIIEPGAYELTQNEEIGEAVSTAINLIVQGELAELGPDTEEELNATLTAWAEGLTEGGILLYIEGIQVERFIAKLVYDQDEEGAPTIAVDLDPVFVARTTLH